MNNIVTVHLVGRGDLDPEVWMDDQYKGTWDQLDIVWLLERLDGLEVQYTSEGELFG